MLLNLEQISKSFGAHSVLEQVTARVEDHDRIGLIGPNGAGKSTLLNIIMGELEPDRGGLSRGSSRFGFLRQNSGLESGNTIHDEMRGVFRNLLDAQEEMRALEAQIAGEDPCSANYSVLTARYNELQTLFEAGEGYQIDAKIATVLNNMGFLGIDTATPVSVLSGGEKTRLALCKLLLEAPDLLILDEPTNHLDFKTLLWLEEYLLTYRGALLIVSHDRYFLDRLCTRVWALDRTRLEVYNGNYTRYTQQKEERDERLRKEYEQQQEEIADMKDFIARNIVRASTTARAQSRQKALDRLELVEKPKPPRRPAKIRFTYKREPVKDVLLVEDLTLRVGEGPDEKTLCGHIGLEVQRGEKIAVIGHNGVGKSSFLKAIQNLVPIDSGEVFWGKNTEISYFEQEDFSFTPGKTVLDELWDRFPREYEHTIRTILGNVGLTGENVYKRVSDLSGGERAKLKFAQLMLSYGNVLLMDEPTNHLDLPTKEALDDALREYTGTLLVVSHDRYLLNQFPDKIIEMHPDHFAVYKGNYDAYLRQRENGAPVQQPAAKEMPGSKPASSYRGKRQRSEQAAKKRRIAELESQIEQLEREIFELENNIADPEFAGDYVRLGEACDRLSEKRLELGDRMTEWTALYEDEL